jgi:serine/threonine protein kinase
MDIIANKYKVLRQLGIGGYGTVHLVQHLDLGSEYAIKLLNPEFLDDDRLVELFRHEAEILSKFSHPRCAQFRDFGKLENGHYYMTTDYCPGETLYQILTKEEWLPVLEALKITSQILEVLAAAHDKNIIHRDVKPGNIMITRDKNGEVSATLLDFGIAALTTPQQKNGPPPELDDETIVAGTPQYMSPEQAAGEATYDCRIDIYSLGIVLYEALTGTAPFMGDSVVNILVKHLTQAPAPFAKKLGIPSQVEDLVFHALAKNPDHRFQTAQDFKDAVDKILCAERQEQDFRTATSLHHTFLHSLANQKIPLQKDSSKAPILCLDDNDMILNITRHILEKDGFRVLTATDFTIIYDYIFSEGCQLMLCDVEMPGIPGSKICQMLKKTQPELKIVLFSNIHERDLAVLAKECQADSWISKNSRPEHWIQEVRRILDTPTV